MTIHESMRDKATLAATAMTHFDRYMHMHTKTAMSVSNVLNI